MAIQYARVEIVNRGAGGSACCKGAYNARSKINDARTNITYNFQNRGDNVYHDVLLPEYVDLKFKDIAVLMNEVERSEKRKNSQLLKDIIIALPDDKELDLQDRINITHRIIDKMAWVKNGLAVQVDIHQPHDSEKNWHVHILLTTRRFDESGKYLDEKARDLNPEFKSNYKGKGFIIPEEKIIHEYVRDIQNDYFKELGMDNRVDAISAFPQEHLSKSRMRGILNTAVSRNEERKAANIELLRSGDDILNRITANTSVFSHADLTRTVKCVQEKVRATNLVEDALASSQIVSLYNEDGKESGLYTTKEVRDQELKLMRLATAISNRKNLITREKSESLMDKNLVGQQQEALSHLLFANEGIRILKGRAGTGKSYVLGKLASISKASGIEVIGLAPTHKAKCSLEEVGYTNCDTVKGFLFKLYNNRTTLAKNSLIIVDEAAMIGNDDYSELLRVAAYHHCNIILSGDERQLSSISRGGMFTSFAKNLGCYELNHIRRQEVEWGKEVAASFARGDTKTGLEVLLKQERLLSNADKITAIKALLSKWNSSSEQLTDKLIIAIKNSDVDMINASARALLKSTGILNGTEYALKVQNHQNNKHSNEKTDDNLNFIAGDRIVFKRSNKALGINNGDFATLESLNANIFKAKLDNGKEIEFNPNEFSDFRHGYASTVYKAQGASIKDVYVFHDGFSTNRNAYVAMSRHVKDLHIFTHREVTSSVEQLVKQLEFNPEHEASINYYTKDELQQRATPKQDKGLLATAFNKVTEVAKKHINSFIDQRAVATGYYNFELPPESRAKVEAVLNDIYDQNELLYQQYQEQPHEQQNTQAQTQEQKMVSTKVVNGRGVTTITNNKQTAKERFYANVEHHRNQAKVENAYKEELDTLKEQLKLNAGIIANSLLGEPNKKLTNNTTYRYGDKGSLAITVTGHRAGTWYDFEEGKGGDLISLVSRERAYDFKQSVEYLKEIAGNYRQASIRLVTDHEVSDKYIDHQQQIKRDQVAEAAKARITQSLYNRSKDIEKDSVAARYLAEHRNIAYDLNPDIRTVNILDRAGNKKLPVIVAFARDSRGKITGGQQILLDPETANKADREIPKKSFGKIAGSFVEVAAINSTNHQDQHSITIIAEGLETALSIKQAGINAKILCSLGISNIKNYLPRQGEKIIIAADHDPAGSITNKTIDQAQATLSENAMVRVVRPKSLGDFNDIIQQRGCKKGSSEIRELFAPVIANLNQYSKSEVAIIADYEQLRGESSNIDLFLTKNQHLYDDLLKFNPKYDMSIIREKLADLKDKTREELLKHELSKEMRPCIEGALTQFKNDKLNSKNIDEFLAISRKEKEFCEGMYKDHEVAVKQLWREGYSDLSSRYHQYETNPNVLDDLEKYYHDAIKFKVSSPGLLMIEVIRKEMFINDVCDNIFRQCSQHVVNEIKTHLESIRSNGTITKDGKEFTNHNSYLEHVMHDEATRPYIKDFAKTKLFEVNRAACQQRLAIYKEHKQAVMLKQHQLLEHEQQQNLELDKIQEHTYNKTR